MTIIDSPPEPHRRLDRSCSSSSSTARAESASDEVPDGYKDRADTLYLASGEHHHVKRGRTEKMAMMTDPMAETKELSALTIAEMMFPMM